MKLFRVTYAFDVLVVADDHDKAREVANENARYEWDNLSPCDCVEDIDEIHSADQIPRAWKHGVVYDNCEPENQLTASQVMDRIEADRRPADLPGQQKLFAEGK